MKRVFLVATALTLSACGAREALVPPAGKPLPVAPYAAKAPPASTDLLKPPVQTRPERSDNLIESGEERRSDEFDLPPPN
ncbi:MAG: hypothetical protein V4574_07490 [Pseudomonadota bacterium]